MGRLDHGRPRALLLDLDDTLLDGGTAEPALARTCGTLAAAVPGIDAVDIHSHYRQMWDAYRPDVEQLSWTGHLDGASIRTETWRRTLHTCGCRDEALVELAAATHQRELRSTYRLFDDAVELLAAFSAIAMPMAIVTNGPSDVQREKLRAVRLDSSIAIVVVSGEVGVAKPDPAIFAIALEALDVAAAQAWHVGDGLTNDVGGAGAAGLVTVWLNRNGRELRADAGRPDLQIARLSELVARLA